MCRKEHHLPEPSDEQAKRSTATDQAGKAYLAAIQDDPEAKKTLLKLRLFAEAIRATPAPLGGVLTARRPADRNRTWISTESGLDQFAT
jgi:hypothetical protein